jgi:hypothetical protein
LRKGNERPQDPHEELRLSVLFLGGEAPLIEAVKSSHAKLNTALSLSSLELAPAQLQQQKHE